ncbi:MAG: DUF4038 domain-containing protein, partial [Nitrospinales bacterium]
MVKQWEAYEISLTTSNSYTNEQKYQDVTLEATFTGPDGSSYTVPGFWDGVDTWKIRFTPTVEGSWNYTISSSDSQLDSSGNDGGFTAGSVSASDKSENQNYRGFLKVSTDQRHFTYDDGTPFFWMGETLWDGSSLQMAFDDTEFKFLIDDRKSKGFTAIQIAVAPPRAFREGPDSTDPLKPGWNEGGFVFNELFSEINPEYFKWLDKRIEYIVQAGMVPVIFGQWGWGVREMADAPSGTGIERLKKYWRYIIARYQAYNVVWVVSGEYRFGFVDRIRLLGEYIHETDGMEHLTTIHPGPPSTGKLSSSLDYHDAEWLDFNMNHTWEYDERSALLADYDKSPTKPIVNAEAGYLGLKDHGRARVRREAWTVFTSGGAGYTYGALGIYHWNDGCCDIRNGDTVPRWYDVYDLPSSYDMKHLVKFFSEFDWEKMSPRDDLVSKGYAL